MIPRFARVLRAVLVVLFLVLGGTATVLQIVNHSTLNALRTSDAINGCRASYRAELVDGPTARALKAFANGDKVALHQAVRSAHPDRYEALIHLSRTHPHQFLVDCRRNKP